MNNFTQKYTSILLYAALLHSSASILLEKFENNTNPHFVK